MRFRINQGSVSLDGHMILNQCYLEIRGKEKIAIVGENGSGKTTLLRLIAGQLSLDSDDKRFEAGIWMARNTTIGFLEQTPFFQEDKTIEELIEAVCPVKDLFSRERYEFETEYHRMFTMFGFSLDDLNKKISEFSGGEQTKIALIRLLLMKSDIMLLDEPTNHLDITTIQWLEDYLKNYEKAVLMVSHDRFFLDQVADVVYELHQGKTKRYSGNYSAYREEREKQIKQIKKRYQEQQDEIQRLNDLIERFKHKPKKASMARSKKKVLKRMEVIESPDTYPSYLYPGEILPDKPGGKTVYDCQKAVIGYDRALHEINLRVKRGQKIGIIGENGIGKSTFLKTLSGSIPLLKGKILEGSNIEMEYYDQMTANIQGDSRLLEDFQKTFPAYSMGDCRKILAKFQFRKENVSKTVSSLSGGEKSRYTFAKILERRPNVLLLDEPTNHLDIPTKEIIESAFHSYSGTILFVTHDRYFLNQLADSLLIFEKDKITYFPYNYQKYLESKQKEKRMRLQGIHTVDEENEAFLHSFEVVPEKKRMQSARFNTEQSYTDWQMQLMGEELTKDFLHYESIWSKIPARDFALLRNYHEDFGWKEEDWIRFEDGFKEMEDKLQESCIKWYEKMLEYEEAFADYHDA